MNKKIGNIFKGDKVIWMVFFFLCMISIVEVFSASSNLTYKSQNYMGPIVFHTVTIILGAVVAVVTLNIPCRYFKLMTPFLLIITVVLLLWVLAAGERTGDASRWINIFGLTFQPSEIAKGTIVLATAQILSAMQRENGADKVHPVHRGPHRLPDYGREPVDGSPAVLGSISHDVYRSRTGFPTDKTGRRGHRFSLGRLTTHYGRR